MAAVMAPLSTVVAGAAIKSDDASILSSRRAGTALQPPQPLSPRKGMNLTDVALHFQFRNCTVSPSPPLGCMAGSTYAFTNFSGLQFGDFLTSSRSVNSTVQCAEQCCGDNECAVWNYKDGRGCFTGSQYDLLKTRAYPGHTLNVSGWLGATRLAPHSWEATHCATYEVQLSRSPGFTPPLITLPTLAYCCPDGGQSCAEAHTLRRCSHECDPKSPAGKCDVDTTSHAVWHARHAWYSVLLADALRQRVWALAKQQWRATQVSLVARPWPVVLACPWLCRFGRHSDCVVSFVDICVERRSRAKAARATAEPDRAAAPS